MKVCFGEDGVWYFDEWIGVIMWILGMLLGIVLLVGCLILMFLFDEMDQVLKECLYNYQFCDDGDVFLVVFWDCEFFGSVCNICLIIDSCLVVEIQVGESVCFCFLVGLWVVFVQGDGICCGEVFKQVVYVQNGQIMYYWIIVDFGLNIGLVLG